MRYRTWRFQGQFMYTFSQLIVRNLVFATLFNIIIIAVLIVFFNKQTTDRQLQQAEIVKVFFTSLEQSQLTQGAQTLLKTKAIAQLSLKNADGNLFNHQPDIPVINQLIAPPTSQFVLANSNVNVNMQIDVSGETTVIKSLSAMLFFISFISAVLAARLSVGRYGAIVERINQQIKQDLHIAFGNKEPEEVLKPIDLPELQQGIESIKSQISGFVTSTSKLEQQAFIEPLTKLENRTRFVEYFENKESDMEFGVLSITRCSELQTINQIHGYNEGDNYICKVADIVKQAISRIQGAKVFRLNSSDFACILPNITIKAAEEFADNLTNKFNDYMRASDLDSVGFTGLVAFDHQSPLGELLALADTGISVAQTQQTNAWYAQTDTSILESNSASYGNQNWRQEIDNVLENQRMHLLVQHIKPNNRATKVYSEFLARFLNSDNEMLPTASFIAMAEKLDKIVDVDRMIVEKAISLIKEKNLTDQHFGINISARSIHDEHFLIWLERRLLRDPNISSNLIFEITEFGLQQNIQTSKRFIDMLHRAGARVTVERFGVGLTSFKFFRDLKPDFIKMDSTYTRDIDEDKNNQYFLRLMIDLAHRLSIVVLAESVESQEEKFTLEKLFIDGCQGFYLGKPEKL